jgi:hypothetical protein
MYDEIYIFDILPPVWWNGRARRSRALLQHSTTLFAALEKTFVRIRRFCLKIV